MNLTNHILIAMPTITNRIFRKSVIYIYKHSECGTTGIIINKPFKKLKIKNILKQFNLETSYCLLGQRIDNSIIMGGPICLEQVFILSSSKMSCKYNTNIPNNTIINASENIIECIKNLQRPNNILFSLGYCIWKKNQIETEILNNFWLTIPYNQNIIFHTPMKKKWITSTQKLGFNIYQLSTKHGHA